MQPTASTPVMLLQLPLHDLPAARQAIDTFLRQFYPDDQTTAPPEPDQKPEQPGLRIAGFCAKYDYSRGGYCKLKREGRGPEETVLGGKIWIVPDAEKRWLADQAKAQRARETGANAPMPGFSINGKKLGRPAKAAKGVAP